MIIIKKSNEDGKVAILFLLIPTIMLIIGYFIFPYPKVELAVTLIQIPIFLSLILLGIGILIKKQDVGNRIKILGWMIFAFYWSTQPTTLYLSEEGDIFNASVCIIGVYVLSYIAYHEWLSIKKKENIKCLNWIAGATCIAGLIYFSIERTVLAPMLIKTVADQSGWMLNLVIGNVETIGVNIFHNGAYVVSIIFACTAIQAMVLFVGMIGALPKVDIKRKINALLITLIPIYILNLLRNALVGFLLAKNITDFYIAHNVLAKIGALITLIILLFIVIKILPEIYDEIICLTELPKRNGPVEQYFKKYFWRKK